MDETLKQQVDNIERKLDDFLSDYYRNNTPTTQKFTKKVIIGAGIDLANSSIGTSSSLMSVYGVTPVAQASAISAPATQGGTYNQSDVQSIVNAVNSIRTAIKNFGISL